jgi:uncharacterized protein DUF4265
MNGEHVNLRVEDGFGATSFEPVHVCSLGGNRFRVLFSPGLVYGVAADDEIEVGAEGEFVVLRRGRNLVVRLLSRMSLTEHAAELADDVQRNLGGRLDGQVARGLAFTIPVSVGFAAVEVVFERFAQNHPGVVWEYGNVYDKNGKSLEWWQHET